MRDPDLLMTMELLATALTPAFVERPALWAFFLGRLVSLTLRHGMSPASPFAFACGGVLVQRGGDYPAGYRLARLGVDLAQRLGDPGQTCRTVGVFVSVVAPWLRPIDACLPLLRESQAAGLAAGELTFGFSAATTAVALQYHRGLELPRVLAEIESGLHLMGTARALAEREMLAGYQRAVHQLMGLTRERGCIEPDPQDCRHQPLRLGCAYLFGDLAEARALSAASAGQLASATRSVMEVEHNFWTSLTLAASCADADPARRQELLAQIAGNQSRLGIWAGNCPENYRHKQLIVAAEVARVEGRPLEAAELYDEAIEAAAQQSFLQDEALASELAGRFHHAFGRKRFARLYLSRALETYLRWGARAKVQVLEEEFPDLRLDLGPPAPVAGEGSVEGAQAAALDLLPLFRAAEAIAGEVVLSRLLGKLMDVCLATAGAERSALVLEEKEEPKGEPGEGACFVRALGSVSEGTSLLREPALSSLHVPARAIERARKSREAVVVADASAHEELSQDPYVRAHGVRSVLAIPVVRQARLLGVLYLENNLATRVFTAERVRLLQLLTAQIAIALENSLLFEELTREIEDRERAETAVRFLAESGAALSESLDYERTLARVARLAVSFIADWCNVDLIDERDQVHRVAAAHRDPAQEERLRELRLLQGEAGPRKATAAVESGRPVLFSEVTDEIVARFAERPEARQLIRELGASSSMVLPLIAGERRLGAITLVSTSRDRRYGPRDLALAEELARRAALAIDNAALYREAREAVRLRDEFLSIASHELNTPVASLQLLSQSIEQGDFASSGAALKTAMRIISRQSRRLAALVRELLDVSHIQGKWLQLHLQPVDLGELVAETVARFAEDLRRAGCSLDLVTRPGLVGNWDRARLDQVITNLLGNALKFAPGKPIEIATGGFDGQARIVVRDRGIGIPPERLPHIFGRFERAVSAAHYGGLGLGLYIVREIVSAHGGTVRVESQPGVGSTFTVELPVAAAPAGQAI